ncbi:MAG: hypothetical protein HON90_01840, partial [Halobacteriovoraceae bacterium]|nr:hypothetical protein [Halobacteriovoraceae bacterium]
TASTVVSGGEDEDDPFSSLLGGGLNEDVTSHIGGSKPEDEFLNKISGSKDDIDEFAQKVSGISEEKEGELVQTFSSALDDAFQNETFNFDSSLADQFDSTMTSFVKNTLEEMPESHFFDNTVKAFLQKEAPARINAGLDEYAKKLGKTLENLSADELATFNSAEMPGLMTLMMSDDESINDFKSDLDSFFNEDELEPTQESFSSKLKKNLEDKLVQGNLVNKDDDVFAVAAGSMAEGDMQALVKASMLQTFEEEFKFSSASPGEIDAKEKLIVKQLAATLGMPEDEVALIIKAASESAKEKEKNMVAQKLFELNPNAEDNGDYIQQSNSKSEAMLIDKLKTVEEENKNLKTSLSVAELRLSATDDVKDKFDKIINNSSTSEDDLIKISGQDAGDLLKDANERQQILSKISDGESVSSNDVNILQMSLEKENKIIELAKRAEMELKKIQLESEKKDALFKTELGKAQKTLKAKDIVLTKAKESIRNALGRKDKDLIGYKRQVNELNQKLKNDQSTHLKSQVKSLLLEKDGLIKAADVYKTKLESVAKNMEKNKKEDNTSLLVTENKNLKRIKTQYENKFNIETKLKKTFEEKYRQTKQAEAKSKTEAINAQTSLKSAQGQIKLLKDQNTKLVQGMSSKAGRKVDRPSKESTSASSSDPSVVTEGQVLQDKLKIKKTKKELDIFKAKNEQLQDKIKDLVAKLKKSESSKSGAEGGSAAEKRLEQSVKKMNSELTKARTEVAEKKKETIKSKTEINKLKNQITQLQRDLEKSNKKGGGAKKKAA